VFAKKKKRTEGFEVKGGKERSGGGRALVKNGMGLPGRGTQQQGSPREGGGGEKDLNCPIGRERGSVGGSVWTSAHVVKRERWL